MNALFAHLTAPSATGGLSRNAWIALILFAVAVLSPGLFSIPAMDRDESRYAQASRQMMETGDFLNIRLQDEDRHKQPAGTYWLQVIAAQPFGGADAPIGAHRVPGFVFSILAVAVTAWLGARFFSPSVGLAAGLVLTTTLVLAVEARTAKTDAILLGVGMVAQAALMILMVQGTAKRPKFWGWPAVLWAAVGASLLVKGPIFFMVTALTAIGYAAWKRDPRLLLRLRLLPGVALALAIFLPWFLAINLATDWAFAFKAVGHSMLGKVGEAQEAHSGPLGFHILATAVTLWPGVALLGLGGLAAWVMRERDEVKFLIAWIIPTYVVFELVATKLPHYTLPSFPAIALLIALGISDAPRLLASARAKVLHTAFAVIAVLVAGLLAAVPAGSAIYLGDEPGLAGWLAAAFGGLAALAIVMLAFKPDGQRLLVASVAAGAFYAAAFGAAIPSIDRLWPSDRAGRVIDQISGCDKLAIATLGYREPSNMFNLGTGVLLGETADQVADFLLGQPECGVAFVDAPQLVAFVARLEAAGARPRLLTTVEGHNAVKGDDLSLGVYVLEGSPLVLTLD